MVAAAGATQTKQVPEPPAKAQVVDAGALDLGKGQEIKLDGSTALRYSVKLDQAGLLTVATRGTGGDLVIEVCDADNQALRGGQTDGDLNGTMCDEQLVVEIPYAETWNVKITNNQDEESKVTLIAGFVAFKPCERAPDPDGRPSLAAAIAAGAAKDDALDTAKGDGADWYKFTATENGRLTIFTKGAEDLDVSITVVTGKAYDEQVGQADEDQEGQTANEGLVVPVVKGNTYYIRIGTVVDSAGAYKVGVQFVAF